MCYIYSMNSATHKGGDMPTKKEQAIKSGLIIDTNDWAKGGRDRTYLTLQGHSPRYRGCTTAKIFIDNADDTLHVDYGKGVAPSEWHASLNALKEIFG